MQQEPIWQEWMRNRMNYQAFLIKYAEIGIKGKNRILFEEALVRQIARSLKPVEGEFEVTREIDRKSVV